MAPSEVLKKERTREYQASAAPLRRKGKVLVVDGYGVSLRVERGYWIFCSEPQFRGECRTFGAWRLRATAARPG